MQPQSILGQLLKTLTFPFLPKCIPFPLHTHSTSTTANHSTTSASTTNTPSPFSTSWSSTRAREGELLGLSRRKVKRERAASCISVLSEEVKREREQEAVEWATDHHHLHQFQSKHHSFNHPQPGPTHPTASEPRGEKHQLSVVWVSFRWATTTPSTLESSKWGNQRGRGSCHSIFHPQLAVINSVTTITAATTEFRLTILACVSCREEKLQLLSVWAFHPFPFVCKLERDWEPYCLHTGRKLEQGRRRVADWNSGQPRVEDFCSC